jgi:hypothetical protein
MTDDEHTPMNADQVLLDGLLLMDRTSEGDAVWRLSRDVYDRICHATGGPLPPPSDHGPLLGIFLLARNVELVAGSGVCELQ